MKMSARTPGSVAVFATVLWATGTLEAQDGKVQATSCRKVVEGFYKWYIPETFRSHSSRYDLPVKSKVYRFDDGLVRLLRKSEAYENRGGDIIDVDPFTGMNGDSEAYIVGNVRQKAITTGLIFTARIQASGTRILRLLQSWSAGMERGFSSIFTTREEDRSANTTCAAKSETSFGRR